MMRCFKMVGLSGLAQLDNLVELNLENCDLADLDFLAKFKALKTLGLSKNEEDIQIIIGSIIAGNDNPTLLKKLQNH